MAYINATEVKAIRDTLKIAFPDFKFSVRGSNHSSVAVSIMSGPMDFSNLAHYQINHYYIDENHTPQRAAFLNQVQRIIKCAGKKHYDNSDAMTDYFSRSHYTDINIGQWNKPYVCTVMKAAA